ncbi:unnamed protein product, partial [Symbiodinium sp. KB8]
MTKSLDSGLANNKTPQSAANNQMNSRKKDDAVAPFTHEKEEVQHAAPSSTPDVLSHSTAGSPTTVKKGKKKRKAGKMKSSTAESKGTSTSTTGEEDEDGKQSEDGVNPSAVKVQVDDQQVHEEGVDGKAWGAGPLQAQGDGVDGNDQQTPEVSTYSPEPSTPGDVTPAGNSEEVKGEETPSELSDGSDMEYVDVQVDVNVVKMVRSIVINAT